MRLASGARQSKVCAQKDGPEAESREAAEAEPGLLGSLLIVF